MAYEMIRLSEEGKNRVSLTRISEEKENFLESLNGLDERKLLSYDEVINGYFRKQENCLIKEIKIVMDNDMVNVIVEYFSHDKNLFGEYWFEEWERVFLLAKNTYEDSVLGKKIVDVMREVNDNRAFVDSEIEEIKANTKRMNEKVKRITEEIIREYLQTDNEFLNGYSKSLSESEFHQYVRENYEYIKTFISDNWQYKKLFQRIFGAELMLTSLGGMSASYRFLNGDEIATAVAIGTIMFGFVSFYVSEGIEKKMIDKKVAEIQKIDFDSDAKVRSKKKV